MLGEVIRRIGVAQKLEWGLAVPADGALDIGGTAATHPPALMGDVRSGTELGIDAVLCQQRLSLGEKFLA